MTDLLSRIRPTNYRRRPSRTVWIGQLAVGGNYPIRVQSMCTSDTKDTAAVMREIEGLVNAGCEIVRLTVPTQADCDNLPNIRAAMKSRGLKVPLVADIHFTPSIAMKAVEYVDKVRINPGNFVDKKLFKVKEYTDDEYGLELDRIREKFVPLVLKCKEYGVAMRIGTNHGSLSDRIMNRYGDTALGMVESALEFLRICEELDYRDIVISMKASNVQVMTTAYRLLAARLDELGWNYPFHLGVTEAGEGEDGRIKSAIGIGSLLEDGLGDTIRVSLTEDAVYEVPVCYELVQKYNALHQAQINRPWELPALAQTTQPEAYAYARRHTHNLNLGELYHGEKHLVRAWTAVSSLPDFEKDYTALVKAKGFVDTPLEGIETTDGQHIPKLQALIQDRFNEVRPLLGFKTSSPEQALQVLPAVAKLVAVLDSQDSVKAWKPVIESLKAHPNKALEWCLASSLQNSFSELVREVTDLCGAWDSYFFSIQGPAKESVYAYRHLAASLQKISSEAPLHLRVTPGSQRSALITAAVNLGCLLLDGLGDSLQVDGNLSLGDQIKLSYNILQGCRLRISKTEYISCPSCGRTLFDLQTTTDKIRDKTGHLKGVKIAVMGCIVNGPGEMADADFGYVGTGPKKISLYVGKECVERNIPEEEAVFRLVDLIKSHNRWVEAPQ